MRISFLGPEGSYSHSAALSIFGKGAEFIPSSTITNVIHDLSSGLANKAVVPIENSIAGGVTETIEALQRSENIYINNEYILSIEHCLLGTSEIKASDYHKINKVRAHHMALGQCMDFIRKNFASAEIIPSSSNSAAAKDLQARAKAGEDTSKHVVIASELCSETYGLKILDKNINDADINQTRFWTLSQELSKFNSNIKNKTTILFQTKDEPGSLQTILRLFAVNHINLSRIESRPAKRNLGEYLFLIDFDIHREDSRYEDLMRQAKQHFTYYKWLGSYSSL